MKFSDMEKKLQEKETDLELAEAKAVDLHNRMFHIRRRLSNQQMAWCNATGFFDATFDPDSELFFLDGSESKD